MASKRKAAAPSEELKAVAMVAEQAFWLKVAAFAACTCTIGSLLFHGYAVANPISVVCYVNGAGSSVCDAFQERSAKAFPEEAEHMAMQLMSNLHGWHSELVDSQSAEILNQSTPQMQKTWSTNFKQARFVSTAKARRSESELSFEDVQVVREHPAYVSVRVVARVRRYSLDLVPRQLEEDNRVGAIISLGHVDAKGKPYVRSRNWPTPLRIRGYEPWDPQRLDMENDK